MSQKDLGFTLPEVLIALTISAIVLCLGAPAIANLLQRTHETTTYHLLSSSLAAARLAAVKNGTAVTTCPSSDGIRCRNDEVWDTGWLTYSDPNHANQPANGDAVLQSIGARGGRLWLRSTRGRTRVRFSPDGWSYGNNLSIRLCTSGGRLAGQVVINNAGRPRTERYAVSKPCPFDIDKRR